MNYDDGKGHSKVINGQFQLGTNTLPKEFEDALEGVDEGFVLKEKIKVPADFAHTALAGKKVSFSITFHEIRDTVPFEVGDAFAQHQGSEDLAAYRLKVREDMIETDTSLAHILQRRVVSKALMKVLDFDVPQSLVDQVSASLLRNHKNKEQNGKLDEESLKTKLSAQAVGLVRLECWIQQLVLAQKLEMTQEELMEYARVLATKERASLEDIIQYLRHNPDELRSIEQTVLERKALNWACTQAKSNPQTIDHAQIRALFEKGDDQ